MEKEKKLFVKASSQFIIDIDHIFQYSIETFGLRQAEIYENEIWKLVNNLSHNWTFFSECRYLSTKSKMYRWIILDSHVIIYRIKPTEIQVLRIIHSHRSITKIKASRSIEL